MSRVTDAGWQPGFLVALAGYMRAYRVALMRVVDLDLAVRVRTLEGPGAVADGISRRRIERALTPELPARCGAVLTGAATPGQDLMTTPDAAGDDHYEPASHDPRRVRGWLLQALRQGLGLGVLQMRRLTRSVGGQAVHRLVIGGQHHVVDLHWRAAAAGTPGQPVVTR